jgi:hypothetical protein
LNISVSGSDPTARGVGLRKCGVDERAPRTFIFKVPFSGQAAVELILPFTAQLAPEFQFALAQGQRLCNFPDCYWNHGLELVSLLTPKEKKLHAACQFTVCPKPLLSEKDVEARKLCVRSPGCEAGVFNGGF